MTPAFHYDRLKRIVPKFCIVADRLVNHWKQYEDGAAVETLPWMSKYERVPHVHSTCTRERESSH